MSGKKLLFIKGGPVYDLHSASYSVQFELLSGKYSGYVLTSSGKQTVHRTGRFLFKAIKNTCGLFFKFRFLLFCLGSAFRLRRLRQKIDLVVSYDPLMTGLIGIFVSWLLRAKLVVEVNGVYHRSIVWKDGNSGLVSVVKRLFGLVLMRFVLDRADGVKLLFKEQLDGLCFHLERQKISVLANFVRVDCFQNLGENKIVLFAGFPFRLKGVDILISAFRKLAGKYPEWQLRILGWYPEGESRRELDDAIAGHPQIAHLEPVPYAGMPHQIGTCGVFVLPSRSEAMGRVLIEAMAAGKPRIGSNVDGIPSVIKDGVDGLLFESENVDDLATKLDTLLGNPQMRHMMGTAGKMRAKNEFSEAKYIERISRFYDEVICCS